MQYIDIYLVSLSLIGLKPEDRSRFEDWRYESDFYTVEVLDTVE